MSSKQPTVRIGEVAARAGVRVSLVRYYDRIGLLPPAGRVSGQRRYDPSALRRLALIDRAQRVRTWLQHAATCGGPSADDCVLFDPSSLPPAPRGRPRAAPDVARLAG